LQVLTKDKEKEIETLNHKILNI